MLCVNFVKASSSIHIYYGCTGSRAAEMIACVFCSMLHLMHISLCGMDNSTDAFETHLKCGQCYRKSNPI